MSRHRILYAVLALVVVATVGAVVYLESEDSAAQATASTSTTTTTTTLPPTTTTTATIPPTTVRPTTLAPTTVAPTTLPPTTLPPPERAAVALVVSSGSTAGERVTTAAFLLSVGGWTNIRGLNGSTPVTDTVVFYADGFQNAAELLALDLSVSVTATAPIAEAPPVAGLADAQLLAYLGGS